MTNEELAIKIQQGDTHCVSLLWDQTEKLFVMFCNKWWTVRGERFAECGIMLDDLKQECYFILIDAVAAYNSAKRYKFTTFIHYHMQNRFNALLGYCKNRRREPLNGSDSLDTPIPGTDDLQLSDLIPDPVSEKPFEQVDQADYVAKLHSDLEAAMQRKLSEQQKNVICDYYYSGLSFAEIGERQGVSADRVKTILQTSRHRLQTDLELKQRYKNEILQDRLYKGTGLSAFKDRGMSSVEQSVEILDRLDTTLRELYGDELVDLAEKQSKLHSFM